MKEKYNIDWIDDNEYYTAYEIAEKLDVQPETVKYVWMFKGLYSLYGYKRMMDILIAGVDLREFLQQDSNRSITKIGVCKKCKKNKKIYIASEMCSRCEMKIDVAFNKECRKRDCDNDIEAIGMLLKGIGMSAFNDLDLYIREYRNKGRGVSRGLINIIRSDINLAKSNNLFGSKRIQEEYLRRVKEKAPELLRKRRKYK